jgi:hypothetical protein
MPEPSEQFDILEAGRRPWTCEYCGREMTVNAKGSHLRACSENPSRPRRPGGQRKVLRGSYNPDAVACSFCGNKVVNLVRHQDRECKVLQAVRAGTVTLPTNEERVETAQRELFEGQPVDEIVQVKKVVLPDSEQEYLRLAKVISEGEKTPDDEDLTREIIELAVSQVVGGAALTYTDGQQIFHAVQALVLAVNHALGID